MTEKTPATVHNQSPSYKPRTSAVANIIGVELSEKLNHRLTKLSMQANRSYRRLQYTLFFRKSHDRIAKERGHAPAAVEMAVAAFQATLIHASVSLARALLMKLGAAQKAHKGQRG